MALMIIFLGLMNICLGIALAVHVGYGPPGYLETWETLIGTVEASVPDPDEEDEIDPAELEAMLDDEVDGEFDDEMYEEMYDDDVSVVQDSDAPDDWDVGEKFVETSLLRLNIAMMKSGLRATEIDTKLRACQGNSDLATVTKCKKQLLEDCKSYLAEQSEAAEKFSNRINELGELSSMGEEIEMANLEQSAQIETSISNLTQVDVESDLEAANVRILDEINNLRMARHKLRDNQEAAFLTIARYEDRLQTIEEQLRHDPLTKLSNRIGLETTLCNWWKQGRNETRQMCAALFDLDGFGQVNENHGSLLADRILHHVAQTMKGQLGKSDLLSRYSGQQFMVILLDAGPRAAIKTVEQIRQVIERISFVSGDHCIQVTVAGGFLGVRPEDSDTGVMERLEKTLRAAKEAGPNRMFALEGDEAEEIESPVLRAEYVDIPI